jgi:excisionase family DNA binding protein
MNDLFSIAEAAQKLAISAWTIRAHLKRGAIKPVRVGRRVLIPRKELERLAIDGLPSLSHKTAAAERLSREAGEGGSE